MALDLTMDNKSLGSTPGLAVLPGNVSATGHARLRLLSLTQKETKAGGDMVVLGVEVLESTNPDQQDGEYAYYHVLNFPDTKARLKTILMGLSGASNEEMGAGGKSGSVLFGWFSNDAPQLDDSLVFGLQRSLPSWYARYASGEMTADQPLRGMIFDVKLHQRANTKNPDADNGFVSFGEITPYGFDAAACPPWPYVQATPRPVAPRPVAPQAAPPPVPAPQAAPPPVPAPQAAPTPPPPPALHAAPTPPPPPPPTLLPVLGPEWDAAFHAGVPPHPGFRYRDELLNTRK